MRRFFAFVFVAVLIVGCAKDIIVRPPATLRGFYTGKYIVIRSYDTSSPKTDQQWINWTFTDQRFKMDSTRLNELPQVFCGVDGNYRLTSAVMLSDTIVQAITCNHDDVPVGEFSLIRLQTAEGADSLTMEQYQPVNSGTKKIIIIVKKS